MAITSPATVAGLPHQNSAGTRPGPPRFLCVSLPGTGPGRPRFRRMIDLVIYLAVLVIVVCLVWWLIGQIPLPEPAAKFVRIAVVVVVAVVVIMLLLNLTGHGPPLRLR